MKKYSVTLVFDKQLENLLVCYHEKLRKFNFVGGKAESGEQWEETAYRELYEETGVGREDIELFFIRNEQTVTGFGKDWDITVSAGILNKDFELVEGENHLWWLPIKEIYRLVEPDFMGDGNCYLYYIESRRILGIETEDCYLKWR